MNEEELQAIEARAAVASPGPWGWDGGTLYDLLAREKRQRIWDAEKGDPLYDADEPEALVLCAEGWLPNKEADKAFIAAARSDVPALVAEVRAVRGEVNHLEDCNPACPLARFRSLT